MRYLKAILLLLVSVSVFFLLNYRHGMVPPMGKLLNPFAGFWLNNSAEVIPVCIPMKNLKDSVVIVWDDRRVPHIFAQNTYDLYFAQGFITARDRLWQMEFQADLIAGELAEIAGAQFLEYDQFMRRCGITFAAEQMLKEVFANAETRFILEAYTDGVNAYIRTVDARNRPLEYKILDYLPEPWTFLKSALIAKFMSWNLTAFDISELYLTRARVLFGEEAADELYPNVPPFTDPVIPEGTKWRFQASKVPSKPTSSFTPRIDEAGGVLEPGTVHGSNSWVVGTDKTTGSGPIMCNDFHLPLYLPCMWYEVQLIGPDMNTYGVSLPGVPLVIVGFNENVAWGATNAMTDVIDWYEIEFKDESRSAYLHDGTWMPTRKRIEEIKLKEKVGMIDTVIYTHHGPVVCDRNEKQYDPRVPKGAAMRWVGHDPSNEFLVFLQLNRASSYGECQSAIEQYDCPGLNLAFADVSGDIALWHAGKFPIRWAGQGRYISDGRSSEYDWHDWIPREHLPHVENPRRGFVSSANQYPVDEEYPYYLGGSYWSFDRGARINEILNTMENITVDSMIAVQNDVTDVIARKILPFLLAQLDKSRLFPQERRSYEVLETWNNAFETNLIAPVIFTYWRDEISEMIWSDEMKACGGGIPRPRIDVTVSLMMNERNSEYFDVSDTPYRDELKEIIVRAFHGASNKLSADLGSFGDNWIWGRARTFSIEHLGQIPGLGRMNLSKAGNEYTIDVKHSTSTLGRSWRMVVNLGHEPKGWGIYPGGQSGNPGSRFYDSHIDDWASARVYELVFLASVDDKDERVTGRTVLESVQ
jgi:penicillin amidase